MNGDLDVSTPPALKSREIRPPDILSGLGLADRPLLAACIALFEDSTLSRRVSQLYDQLAGKISAELGNSDIRDAASSVQSRMQYWLQSEHHVNELRLILWIYLREAFDLDARLTISSRGSDRLVDDLAAAAIAIVIPQSSDQQVSSPVTLAALVRKVLEELLSAAFVEGAGQMGAADRKKLVEDIRVRVGQMNAADQKKLLQAVGAEELNDSAIQKILLTGGGLAGLSAGVGMSGFAAYILAAKASAFIPFVSGPALVSAVSVLSNPITAVAGTGAAIWWFTTSASDRVKREVGVRVIALMAMQGISSRNSGIPVMLESFSLAGRLKAVGDLSSDICAKYRSEWHLLEPLVRKSGPVPTDAVIKLMDRTLGADELAQGRLTRLLFPGKGEAEFSTTLALLTIGDIAYSAASIDPSVIQAVDFARVEDVSDLAAFSVFADKLQALSPSGVVGAVSNVKGYVAEQLVAAELASQGHQVEFPETSNQAGWDLLVDGEKFQVKWLGDPGGLTAHFEKYDYPVLANAELADQIPANLADRVFFVEGYTDELVSEITNRSIEAGANIINPDVPVFAIGLVAVRELREYQVGHVTGAQAVHQVLLEGATRSGLAATGGYVGAGIGLLVFGPAGALVFGAGLPVLAQAQSNRVLGLLDDYITTEDYRDWRVKAQKAIKVLEACLNAALGEKEEILRRKYKSLGKGMLSEYVKFRFVDEARFLRESRARLQQVSLMASDNPERCAMAMIGWAGSSTVHAVKYQAEMMYLSQVLADRPDLSQRAAKLAQEGADKAKEMYGYAAEFLKGFFGNDGAKK